MLKSGEMVEGNNTNPPYKTGIYYNFICRRKQARAENTHSLTHVVAPKTNGKL